MCEIVAFCDDEQAKRNTLRLLLADWSDANGQPVTLLDFDTGKALLDADDARPFDAVILDIYLPELGGVETARILRAHRNALPIVFLGSSADHKDGTRLLIRREGRREIKKACHSHFLAQMRDEV